MNHEPTPAKVRLTDGLGPASEARWYAVTKSGLATLCASERDALESAASFDVAYPHSAPHRAVLLGDVERLRSALADLVSRYDQRLPLRERPEYWDAARDALKA